MMPDHVHMLVLIPPKITIFDFTGYLINISTVDLNGKTVAKYVREQEKNNIALEKLSVKACEDPFSDGRFRIR